MQLKAMMSKNVKLISISIDDSNQVMKQVKRRSMQRKPFSGQTSTVMLVWNSKSTYLLIAYSSVPTNGTES